MTMTPSLVRRAALPIASLRRLLVVVIWLVIVIALAVPARADFLNRVQTLNASGSLFINGLGVDGIYTRRQAVFADVGNRIACTQLADLTGDVTNSALNLCALTIGNAAVTYAKFQNVAAARLLGNPSGSAASVSEIALGATFAFAGTALQTVAISGDCTTLANSFSITCTKTNNVAFAPSATTDTTNAANITSGILPAARLPTPTSSALGGVKSAAAPANNFQTGVDATGAPTFARPIFADIAPGTLACTQLVALNGDVVTVGCVATIANAAVTYAKFQNVAAASLVGNPTGSSATAQAISLGATLAFSGTALQTVAMSGDCTTLANSFSISCTKTNNVAFAPSATTDTTNASNISSGTLAAARLPANGVANSNLATAGAATVKGNPTATAGAAVTDYTIQGLPTSTSPSATADYLEIYDSASGAKKKVTPSVLNSASASGVSTVNGLSGNPSITGGVANSVTTSGSNIIVDASASDRGNLTLNRVGVAKAAGTAQRGIGRYDDGFADALGINTGASSGYFANTSAKTIYNQPPAQSAAAPSTTGNWANYSGIDTSSYALTNGATIVSMDLYSTGSGSAAVKIACGGAGTFNVTYTQNFTHSGGGYQTVALTTPQAIAAANCYPSFFMSTTGASSTATTPSSSYYFVSGNTPTGSGAYTNSNTSIPPMRVTYQPQNTTLITNGQTPDASVGNVRASIILDPSSSPTWGTSDTMEGSCNGGTNYASLTMSLIGKVQNGNLYESADATCTSGTSFLLRYKVLTNGARTAYGLSAVVH